MSRALIEKQNNERERKLIILHEKKWENRRGEMKPRERKCEGKERKTRGGMVGASLIKSVRTYCCGNEILKG